MLWGWWGSPVPAAAPAAPEEGGWAPAGTWVTLALAGWLGSALGLVSPLNRTSVKAHSTGPDCAPEQPAPRTRILAGGVSISSPFTSLIHSILSKG